MIVAAPISIILPITGSVSPKSNLIIGPPSMASPTVEGIAIIRLNFNAILTLIPTSFLSFSTFPLTSEGIEAVVIALVIPITILQSRRNLPSYIPYRAV